MTYILMVTTLLFAGTTWIFARKFRQEYTIGRSYLHYMEMKGYEMPNDQEINENIRWATREVYKKCSERKLWLIGWWII